MGFFFCLFPPSFKFLSCLHDDDDDDLFYISSFISYMGRMGGLWMLVGERSEGVGSFLSTMCVLGIRSRPSALLSEPSHQFLSISLATMLLWLISPQDLWPRLSPVSSLCGDSPLHNAASSLLSQGLPTVLNFSVFIQIVTASLVTGLVSWSSWIFLGYSVHHTYCVNDLQQGFIHSWTCRLFETHHCG